MRANPILPRNMECLKNCIPEICIAGIVNQYCLCNVLYFKNFGMRFTGLTAEISAEFENCLQLRRHRVNV